MGYGKFSTHVKILENELQEKNDEIESFIIFIFGITRIGPFGTHN